VVLCIADCWRHHRLQKILLSTGNGFLAEAFGNEREIVREPSIDPAFEQGSLGSVLAIIHFKSGRSLLRRGQIGTVIMPYPAGAYEVEFADRDGRAFAILSLRPEQLMVLHDIPDFAAA
jgi:hypothetical protein